MCATCVFAEGNPAGLRPGRADEIRAMVIGGTNQLCHEARTKSGRQARVVCRGGRDFALMMWHRLGILPEPTDAALAEASARSCPETRMRRA